MRSDANNIDIDDRLIRQAMRSSGARTKRAAVEEGLRLLIQTRSQKTHSTAAGQGDLGRRSRGLRRGTSREVSRRGDRRHDRLDRLLPRRHQSGDDWLHRELDQQRLGLTDVIVCEASKALDEAAAKDVERQLLKLEVFETGGIDLARETARNYRTLRGRGHTVRKTIDCLIATFCIREPHSLFHRDRDFDLFEKFLGLSVIHP